ncbi:MAG: hypothetical protein WCD70_05245 [Alphaproteobacteria bacterium]
MSKAGRPKKGSAGLPEWFDIKKYRDARSYGAAEWFQHPRPNHRPRRRTRRHIQNAALETAGRRKAIMEQRSRGKKGNIKPTF